MIVTLVKDDGYFEAELDPAQVDWVELASDGNSMEVNLKNGTMLPIKEGVKDLRAAGAVFEARRYDEQTGYFY